MTTLPLPKVLAFDVFGTVVDWHGSIKREIEAIKPGIDGAAFALAWRAGYFPAMDRVREGKLGWANIDTLHRGILDTLLERYGLTHLDEAQLKHLNLAWHRLDPWPEAVAGLERLRSRFTVCTLSNGNLGLLANMAKRAGLRWDLILSAEVFRHYKPDPQTYLGVCDIFDLQPAQMMLVAAHKEDLAAARACGCQGAYVERVREYGPRDLKNPGPDAACQYNAVDFNDLADQLGCP
jgi:2-haloacid dehalogenase